MAHTDPPQFDPLWAFYLLAVTLAGVLHLVALSFLAWGLH